MNPTLQKWSRFTRLLLESGRESDSSNDCSKCPESTADVPLRHTNVVPISDATNYHYQIVKDRRSPCGPFRPPPPRCQIDRGRTFSRKPDPRRSGHTRLNPTAPRGINEFSDSRKPCQRGQHPKIQNLLGGAISHQKYAFLPPNVFIISDAQPPTTHPNRNSRSFAAGRPRLPSAP